MVIILQNNAPPPPTHRETAARGRRGVLIVEHDDALRALLGMFFGQQKLPFWLAHDALEAAKIQRRHAEEIGFVLVDVETPGWDGPGTLSLLRKRAPAVPCYLMGDDPWFEQDTPELENVRWISKSFLTKMLGAVAFHCLARS